jgi:hypothetical protein
MDQGKLADFLSRREGQISIICPALNRSNIQESKMCSRRVEMR